MIIAEMEREDMSWEKSLGEPIDNSLDAGATRIVITMNKKAKRVTIQDNGVGCPVPHLMLIAGHTTKRGAKSALGRYGVGLKHASYWLCGLGGKTAIVTSHANQCKTVSVSWSDIVNSDAWEINAPEIVAPDEIGNQLIDINGTSINFLGVKPRFLDSKALVNTLDKISFTYFPAIRAGRQIVVVADGKPITLSAPRDPSWSKMTEFTVEIEHRKAIVRAGIIAPNDKTKRRGMSFSYGHRVIIADTASGCGDYSPNGFSGFVELDANWKLGQNKSEVTDEKFDELCDRIAEGVRPLLEELKNSTHELKSDEICAALSDRLSSALESGTGSAMRPNRQGSEREKEKTIQRSVRRASIVGGVGTVIGKRAKGGKIAIDVINEPENPRAVYIDQNEKRIYINRALPRIARAIDSSEDDYLMLLVMTEFIASKTYGGPMYVDGDDGFSERVGKFIAGECSIKRATT